MTSGANDKCTPAPECIGHRAAKRVEYGQGCLKFSYDREEDILTIETASAGAIDHAEQTGSLIAHFGKGGELLLLEILDASEFLSSVIVAALRDQERVKVPGT